ncbi:hypothetical protein DXG01_015961 [Tephrocybe rancida]|nr:hypothetical protein DXG01_015961 [Tephrocybe rancida]
MLQLPKGLLEIDVSALKLLNSVCLKCEREEAAARKQEAAACHEVQAKKTQVQQDKAAGITQDSDNSDLEERPDTMFTSCKVLAKPAQHVLKATARAIAKPPQQAISMAARAFTPMKRTSKVPPAPAQQLTPRAPDACTTFKPEDEPMDYASNIGSDDDIHLVAGSDIGDDDMEGSDCNEDDELEADYEEDKQFPGQDTYKHEPISDRHHVYSGHVNNAAFPCGVPIPHLRPLPGKPVPERVVLDLCTPTPSSSNKRCWSKSLNNATVAPTTIKAMKISDNIGCPKASDYDDTRKETILTAANIFCCLISTFNGFPDSSTEIDFRANEDLGLEPPIDLTPDIGKIIKQRGSQTREEAKSKTASLVETMYGFNSGQGRKIVIANCNLAEQLKLEKGFLYKELTEDIHKGIYKHPIIQMAINKMWFKNKCDEGVVYTDMFYPMPIPAIALILTAIECNIDKWVSGTKTDIAFYADDYRTMYMKHIESLKTFGEATSKHGLLETMQKRLHNFGCQHAGVALTALKDEPAILMSAFEAALKEYKDDEDKTDEDGEIASF